MQCVLFDMLNKYFIVQIAENTFILHWNKNQNRTTGLPGPSPGEIEVKKIVVCFAKPTPVFSDVEMKVAGNSIVGIFRIYL